MLDKAFKENTPRAEKAAGTGFDTVDYRRFSQGRKCHAMGPGTVVTRRMQSQIDAIYATALSNYLFHSACNTLTNGSMPLLWQS
jgi:hypothetical protein